MAAWEEHCRDCERLVGSRCEDVNSWMDDLFKQYHGLHRFARHHWRGVEEAGQLFGEIGRKAAVVHILKDCGFVPKDRDWKEQKVDSLGMMVGGIFNGYWDPWKFDAVAKRLLKEM
jgi:hypothetical protein